MAHCGRDTYAFKSLRLDASPGLLARLREQEVVEYTANLALREAGGHPNLAVFYDWAQAEHHVEGIVGGLYFRWEHCALSCELQ